MFDTEAFIDGYVTAALWADCYPVDMSDNGETGGCEGLTIRPEAREKMAGDCRSFVESNRADLDAYVEACESGERVPYRESEGPPESYAGHDFWLTRGGHGCGFWDRGLGELGERLSDAARVYGADTIGGHDPDAPHTGHFSRLGGAWWCDTCNSPYCELA